MEKRFFDKKTGIQYELQGDYYLPCLTLPEQPKVEIGIWGAGVRWTPLPQAEAPTEPTGETAAFAVHQAAPQNPLYQSADKL